MRNNIVKQANKTDKEDTVYQMCPTSAINPEQI